MTEFSTSPLFKNKLCCADLSSCFGCADKERILSPSQYRDVKKFFQTHSPSLDVPLGERAPSSPFEEQKNSRR
jgi:hypothetical protein